MAVKRVRVGDVLELRRRPIVVEPLEEYTLIGVYSFGKGVFHREPRAGSDLGDYRFFAIEPGDLVLSNIQAWEGAVTYATESDRGTVGTHRFLTYRPVGDRIDANWARWFFLSEAGMGLIRKAAPGTTMRNRTLAIQRFESLEIPLPSMRKQRADLSRINAVQVVSATTASAIARNASSQMCSALPSFTDAIIAREGLQSAPLGELVEFVADTVFPHDDPRPADQFVGLQHIERNTGRVLGGDPLAALRGRKFRFQPGDVVYGYLRPYLNKVWVAERHGLCSVDQYVLRPRAGVCADLLGYVLRGRRVLDSAIGLTHSLQLPRLRSALLADIEVPFETPSAAARLVTRLDRIRDNVIAAASARDRQVHATRALVPAVLHETFSQYR